MSKESTALARSDDAGVNYELSTYDPSQYNVLMPMTRLDTAASCLRYQVVEVRLDPDPQRGDCYPAPGGKNLALSKTGLLKVASAVGLVMDHEESGFVQPDVCEKCIAQTQAGGQVAQSCRDCPLRHDVAYKAVGRIPDATVDSGWREYVATFNWELVAERAEIEAEAGRRRKPAAYVESRVAEITRVRHRLAETKAWLRVVRAICNLPHSLPPAQIAKPFVTVRTELVISPEAIAERAAASGAQLYAGAAADTAPAPGVTVEEVPAKAEPEPEAAPEADEPPGPESEEAAATDAAGQSELPMEEPDDGDGDGEPAVVECKTCANPLSANVLAYCQSKRGQEEFGGDNYCFRCQDDAREAHAKSKKGPAKKARAKGARAS